MKEERRIRSAQKGREKELQRHLGMSGRWALVGERGSNLAGLGAGEERERLG